MSTDSPRDASSAHGRLECIATRNWQLWAAAVLLYGAGDVITTFWGLSTGSISEAGPLAAPLIETYGRWILLVVKTVTFTGFYLLWRSLRTPGRVAVPLALVAVGIVVTSWNVVVILSA